MTKTVLGDEKKELLQLNPVLGAGFAASILVRFRVESCDLFLVFVVVVVVVVVVVAVSSPC